MAQMQQGKKVWKRIAKLSWFFFVPIILAVSSFLILHYEGSKVNGEIKAIKEKMHLDSLEIRSVIKPEPSVYQVTQK